jgi:hypothetical protein
MKTRRIQFKGRHDSLVDGKYYTYDELSALIGSTYYCIKNSLYSKAYCTSDDLYPPYSRSGGKAKRKPKEICRLETDAMVMSQNYLRRKL